MMFLSRFSSLAILMVALSGTAAIAAPDTLPYDRFEQTIAQGPGGGGRGQGNGQGRGGDRWISKLNLSADQQQQIEQIRQSSQGEFDRLQEQTRQAHEQMRQLMSDNASDSQLRNQHRQLQELNQQMGNLRFEQMLKIRAVLTEAQRRELGENMQERWDDDENGGGRGQGQGRGQGRGQGQGQGQGRSQGQGQGRSQALK
jgi:Spy/CpxP family protein refolding chaperone